MSMSDNEKRRLLDRLEFAEETNKIVEEEIENIRELFLSKKNVKQSMLETIKDLALNLFHSQERVKILEDKLKIESEALKEMVEVKKFTDEFRVELSKNSDLKIKLIDEEMENSILKKAFNSDDKFISSILNDENKSRGLKSLLDKDMKLIELKTEELISKIKNHYDEHLYLKDSYVNDFIDTIKENSNLQKMILNINYENLILNREKHSIQKSQKSYKNHKINSLKLKNNIDELKKFIKEN